MKRLIIFAAIALMLTGSAPRAGSFLVSWQPNAPGDSVLVYHIYEVSGVDTLELGAVGGADSTFEVAGVVIGVIHRYILRAENKYGFSPASNAVEGITVDEGSSALCEVAATHITADGRVAVLWTTPVPAIGGLQFREIGAADTTFSVTVLWPGELEIEHVQHLDLARGSAWMIRPFAWPGFPSVMLIVGLPVTVDRTGSEPAAPEVEISPF